MVAGSLDVCGGTGSVPVLAAVERGLVPDKITALAVANVADPGHRALGVVVGPSIKTWKDLQGQRVAANARNSITAAGMLARLKTEGVTEYSLVEIPFSNMGLAVDAVRHIGLYWVLMNLTPAA
jgi:ABC-type nitrate/sulfonate/bicarbonate transport system substrate-binding protein